MGYRVPTLVEVTRALVAVAKQTDWKLAEGSIDVRLQVTDRGEWQVHFGSCDYDQDHRGHWGAASLDQDYKAHWHVVNVARALLDQVEESVAEEDGYESLTDAVRVGQ